MPPPTHPIPASLPPLHLYRHLLRELSYLPPAFRSTISSTIKNRFHRNRINDPRPKAHIKRAQSALRVVRAANCGDKPAMESLISKGFGRAGARRRELMSLFVKPQGPSDSKALEALLDSVNSCGDGKGPDAAAEPGASTPVKKKRPSKSLRNAFYEKWDQPKLLQLLQAQKKQQKDTKTTTSWPGTMVKSTDQDQFVPETNIWGKPPGQILVRAKRAHWWRRNADKLMPPLGKGEWDLLQRLSLGAQEKGEWRVPMRRSPAKPLIESDEDGEQWDWESRFAAPAAVLERPNIVGRQRRTGQRPKGPFGNEDRDRDLSARWFRRAYNRVWQLTPNMEQDPNTLRYSVAWGSVTSRLPEASKAQLDVFKGVDNRGQRLKPKSAS